MSTYEILKDLEPYYLYEYLPHCFHDYSNPMESLRFLRITSNIIFLITTPINLFGIYCIVVKSPVEMLTIKWCMLYLHSLGTFASIWMTIGMTPFVFFPGCAGFTNGLLPYLHVPVQIQGYIAIGCLGMLSFSLPILFENRHRYLVDHYKITRPLSRTLFYAFNVLFVPFCLLWTFSIVPPQTSARQLILQRLPCPSQEYFFHTVFVLTLDHIPITSYLIAVTMATTAQIIFFGGHSLIYLAYGPKTTSSATRRLQRKFFLVISVQLTVPCVFLLIPLIYFIFSMITDFYSQAINNICVLSVTLYGMFATLTMIILHNPYQKFVRHLFCSRLKHRSVQVKPRKWLRRNALSTITTPVSY